jgi:hypothetical protein
VLKATLVALSKESQLCHIILVSSDFGFLKFLEEPPAGRKRCKRRALVLLVLTGLWMKLAGTREVWTAPLDQ